MGGLLCVISMTRYNESQTFPSAIKILLSDTHESCRVHANQLRRRPSFIKGKLFSHILYPLHRIPYMIHTALVTLPWVIHWWLLFVVNVIIIQEVTITMLMITIGDDVHDADERWLQCQYDMFCFGGDTIDSSDADDDDNALILSMEIHTTGSCERNYH